MPTLQQCSQEDSPHAGERQKPTFSHPELNPLRFVAFLLVFLDHSQPVHPWLDRFMYAGAYGVPIFFLLSAYLIISLLRREQEASGTIRLGFFAVRRMLRIWPLYFVMLIGGFVLGEIHPDVFMPKKMLLAFLFPVGNFYVASKGWTFSPDSILWTLSVEEQFYLVIPLVAKFGGRMGLKIACWSALLCGSALIFYYGFTPERFNENLQLNSVICFHYFAAGGLLALYPGMGLRGRRLGLRCALAIAGLLLFVVASHHATSHVLDLTLIDTLVLSGALAIFFAFLNYPARKRSLLGYLGLISYGLYVFHPWCLEFFAELRDKWWHESHLANAIVDSLAFLLTVALAALSYSLFERPILRFKQRFEVIRTIRA